MKTKLLFLALLFVASFQLSNAQCIENVSGFNNNTSVPMYNISGDVSVTINLDNTVTLDLAANFMTADGPDVRAYFVKSNGASDTTLKNTLISNLDSIEFGLVGSLPGFGNPVVPINGAKSFTISIPANDTIEDYDKVFFYCLSFNQFWDLGTFTSFTEENCNLLSVEENVFENIIFYPNPASDKINIKGLNNKTTTIEMYNVLGKKVLNQDLDTSEVIDISKLNQGIYILKINSAGKTKTQRFIIR